MSSVKVKSITEVEFNSLRAAPPYGYSMQDRPPFGYTDPIGENASTAYPQYNRADGRVVSGNDADSIPGVGETEFDSQALVVYPRSLFVLHDNIVTTGGSTYLIVPPGGLPEMNWYGFAPEMVSAGAVTGAAGIDTGLDAGIDVAPPAAPSPAVTFTLLEVPRAPGYMSVRYESSVPSGFVIRGGSMVPCQGFTAFLRVGGPSVLKAPCYTGIRFRVSGSARGNYRWFSVAYKIGLGVEVGYNDATDAEGFPIESGWQYIDRAKLGNNLDDIIQPRYVPLSAATTTNPQKEPDTHVLDARIMGGKLRLLFGDQQTAFLFPAIDHDTYGVPDYLIDAWQVRASGVLMTEWSVHETKFLPASLVVSQDVNLGFVPSFEQLNSIRFRTHYLPNFGKVTDKTQVGWHPSGCVATASVYDVAGTVLRYGLTFTNPIAGVYQGIPYSDLTSAVNAVTFDVPGTVVEIMEAPNVLGTAGNPPLPEIIDVYHDWDQNRLSVRSRCNLTFNNFYGSWTNAGNNGWIDSGGRYPGSFAMRVNMGIVGFGSPKREFSGIGGREFVNNWNGGGKDKLTLVCDDRWAMLDVDVFNLPWFDRWNVRAVLAYLAAIGTVEVSAAQMGFFSLIPFDTDGRLMPYAPSPGIPDNEQYFMPSGPAGTNLTRFTDGQNLRDIFLKITNSIGFYSYFDVFGVLQSDKFHVGTNVVKQFTGHGTPTLQEIFTGEFRGSLRETRNSVTVIGVNALGPLWFPIVAHNMDVASIYDPTVFNYIGWHQPMVWVDSLFANFVFAQQAADSLFAFLRLPDRSVSFTTWYPADALVYPTSMINISYERSGASGFQFFVTSTHSHQQQGQVPTMTMTGRIVPIT